MCQDILKIALLGGVTRANRRISIAEWLSIRLNERSCLKNKTQLTKQQKQCKKKGERKEEK